MRRPDLLTLLACAIFLGSGAAAAQNARFSARSTDYPHTLWAGLDLKITEIQRGEQWSAFSLEEKKGEQSASAAARFFACVSTSLAKQRGYSSVAYLVGSRPRVEDTGVDQKYVWLTAFEKTPTDNVSGTVSELRGVIAKIDRRYGVTGTEGVVPVKVEDFLRAFTCPAFLPQRAR
ncbi:MAG TPA: hypothetical protein VHN19_10760 [Burkholderiales bacterium]|jgi:hypothetical protein|nr:hypothetical protein [Burkholderiales bacterium]